MTSTSSTSTLIEEASHTEVALPSLRPKPIRNEDTAKWSLATRIVFRFVFSYFAVTFGPGLVSMVPGLHLLEKYQDFLNKLVPWVASHILRLSYAVVATPFNGSGDRAFDYGQIF